MLGGTLGYGVVITTYNQKLYASFASDPTLLPDIETMADLFDAVYNEMMEIAGATVAEVPDIAPVPA
jgi:hypothetical protein